MASPSRSGPSRAPRRHRLRRSGNGPTSGRSHVSERSSRWTPIIGAGLDLRLAHRTKSLSDHDFWRRRTAGIQRAQLRRLLRLGAKTEFGRARDFERLSLLDDAEIVDAYRAVVPIADYEGFRAMLGRMREGAEPNVLWPGTIRDFAQTSGTTAGDKYLPISKQMLRSNYRAALDIFVNAKRFGVSLPSIMAGRALFLGGSTTVVESEQGIRTGDLSGLVAPLIRWPLSEIYLPGRTIALMDHWPSKIDAMAKRCLNEDVRMINGMPSWMLVLMERVLELARERGPYETIHDVWPNLQLLVHGGVKYGPFDDRIREIVTGSNRDLSTRVELYPASEGFIAIQDVQHDPGLRLCSDIGNFYEFVPLDQIDRPNAEAFTCETVELGVRYVVVMSTCAGLWRYIIGDVVEFDTTPDRLDGRPGWGGDAVGNAGGGGPCRLRIVGRHRHFVNAFGENLIVEHIENAVTEAARATGLEVGEFTAAPVYPDDDQRAGLELGIELKQTVGGDALARFADVFDEALKAQNVDYTTKRTDGLGMAPPTITPLPAGTFHAWLDANGKLGGQHKCPRCANHREILEAVRGAVNR